MKKECNATNKNYVKEANTLARATLYPPAESVWEERIISQVAAFNQSSDMDFPERAFLVGRLIPNDKRPDGRTLQAINNACTRLAGTTFRLTFSPSHIRVYPIFAMVEYREGIISAKLNQELKPYYLQIQKEFTLRYIPEFRALSKIHSQQVYRLLASWAGKRVVEIPIEQLHEQTNAAKTQRKNFNEFSLKILLPAEKEINEKTTLKFHWEAIKQGRKVTAIRFIFDGGATAAVVDHADEAKNENEELKKWQRLSNACYERHAKAGTTCKPRGGNKCTYCRTRGRMAFK